MSPADAAWVGERLQFYARHLRSDVLAWWLEHAVDREQGGVFTYWNGAGTELRSTDKYVWSQGRWVWTMSTLAQLARARPELGFDAQLLATLALEGGAFLSRAALLPDGTCVSVVTREGAPVGVHDSIYSDLFVALAFSALVREQPEAGWGEKAKSLLVGVARRIADGTARTAPYAVPAGYRAFAPQMILMHTATEIFAATGSEMAARIATDSARAIRIVFADDPDICELKPDDPANAESQDARHRNPGHAIEALWMYAQAAELIPAVRELDPDYLGWLVTAFDHLCGLGWDAENGGLFRFVDRDGGPPKGASGGSTYEAMVKASWDWKLWWPHNEALYAGLLLWVRTGGANMAAWYRRMDDYTFSHFPAGPGREWSQILDRKGRPMDPDPRAALPVKDPYHLMRSLILLIALSDANMPIIRKDQQ